MLTYIIHIDKKKAFNFVISTNISTFIVLKTKSVIRDFLSCKKSDYSSLYQSLQHLYTNTICIFHSISRQNESEFF